MRRLTIALLPCCLVLCSAAALAQQRFDSDEHREAREMGWMFDYDEAKALARKTNRPMLLVFRCVP